MAAECVHQRVADHHAAGHARRGRERRAEEAGAALLEHAGLVVRRVLRLRRGRAGLELRPGITTLAAALVAPRTALLRLLRLPLTPPPPNSELKKPRCCGLCCGWLWMAWRACSSSHCSRCMRLFISASAASCTIAICVTR